MLIVNVNIANRTMNVKAYFRFLNFFASVQVAKCAMCRDGSNINSSVASITIRSPLVIVSELIGIYFPFFVKIIQIEALQALHTVLNGFLSWYDMLLLLWHNKFFYLVMNAEVNEVPG